MSRTVPLSSPSTRSPFPYLSVSSSIFWNRIDSPKRTTSDLRKWIENGNIMYFMRINPPAHVKNLHKLGGGGGGGGTGRQRLEFEHFSLLGFFRSVAPGPPAKNCPSFVDVDPDQYKIMMDPDPDPQQCNKLFAVLWLSTVHYFLIGLYCFFYKNHASHLCPHGVSPVLNTF